MAALITRGKVIENSAAALLARVVNSAGTPIVQAGIASILLRVHNSTTGNLVVPDGHDPGTYAGTTLNPVDVVFDVPKTSADDVRWPDPDAADGYTFAAVLDGSYWPEFGQFQVEIKFTPVSGPAFYALWALDAVNIWSE